MAKPQSNPQTKNKPRHKRRPIHGPATAAMKSKAQTPKPNPFETLWSRRRCKFDVLGKRRKGEERRLGLSRSIAVEKRKKTLMKEYEESGKSSVFVDRRIGEKDGSLEEFEKAVLRMQRERQSKLKRASKYNLSDGEEDEDLYQSNSLGRDDFDDEVPPDDFDDADIDTKNSGRALRNLSLSSMPDSSDTTLFDGEENANKSKSQVMKEIILKSKFYKAEKAKAKEEDEHLMEKLDQDFTSLAQSKALVSLTRPSKINALEALLNKHNIKRTVPEGSSRPAAGEDSSAKEQPDEYDKLVKELVLDRRAYASDRTKTPEEIAQEEKERLEELEKQRRERMLATDDSADEASEDGEEMEKPSSKKIRLVSGDDLGDSFSNGEVMSGKKGWVDQIYENDGEAEGDEDNSEAEGDEDNSEAEGDEDADSDDDNSSEGDGHLSKNEYTSVRDWEQSDDDLCINAEETEHQDEKEINSSKTKMDIKQTDSAGPKVKPAGSIGSLKHENLPYVIEAPKSLTELRNLLDKCSDSEVLEAINRIRACNTIRLSVENRKTMQVFYGVLLQCFAVLANERPLKVNIVNSLVKPLIEMSSETPYFAAICARQRLLHIRSLFVEDIKILGKSCWPSLKTLLLLRLWSLIFPCSDFRHVVMTPVILLICEYLMRCPLTSGRDVAVGSFLCSLLLMVIRQSRKFCPEAVVFLQTLLLSSLEKVPGQKQHFELNYLMEIRTLKPWLHISDHVHDLKPVDFVTVMTLEENSSFFASSDFKASILASVAEMLKEFVVLYEGLSSFSEIFSPISLLLCEVLKNPNLPSLLRNKMQSISDMIGKKSVELNLLKKPLQMRKQKPVPIKLLNPKFEEDFVKGRDYDPDRERAGMRKLKKRLKSEKKGAIRELRKDSQFISRMKEKNRLMEEEERTEKYGKDLAFLQEQEHAFKSGQLGKGRKRRK